jgi:hypothetical protein
MAQRARVPGDGPENGSLPRLRPQRWHREHRMASCGEITLRQHWGENNRTPTTLGDFVMEWSAVAFSAVTLVGQVVYLWSWITAAFR